MLVHQVSYQQSLAGVQNRKKSKGVFLIEEGNLEYVYGQESLQRLKKMLDLEIVAVHRENLNDHLEALNEAEVGLAGWGAPVMDSAFFEKAPRLKAVFYAAGSIRSFVTPAVWEREMIISSAYAVNAVPVGEFTLGVILLSLKHFWRLSREAKSGAPWGDHRRNLPGAYWSTVGLVSAGRIARHVLKLLRGYELNRVIHCPLLSGYEAEELGAELQSLEEVFSTSDVVSIHTPLLESTRGMINGDLISRMKPGATLINTARGEVINEKELIEVLGKRSDLTAVLDVTSQEPPAADSPLLEFPNVVLTPHIAGSQGAECMRLGASMVDELGRYLRDEPLLWQITREMAEKLA